MSPNELRQLAEELGFQAVGVAGAEPPETYPALVEWVAADRHAGMAFMRKSLPQRADPASLLPGVQSVLCFALNYAQPNPPVPGQPRIAAYALGRDYHKVIRAKLRRVAERIEAEGGRARICVDSAPILEREFAHRAGLGWFGKNTLLIDSRRGSWFLLGLVLTDLFIERDAPSPGGCGTCTRCLDACPTGAIIHAEGRWQVDARRCISYQTIEHKGEIQTATHGWTFGCDICQEVCPFNQPRETQPMRARPTTEPDFAPRAWPPLAELAQIEAGDWDSITRGSPVRRAGHEGLRRNARANLTEG